MKTGNHWVTAFESIGNAIHHCGSTNPLNKPNFIRWFIAIWLVTGIYGSINVLAYDPLHPPNTYRSKKNPYYWKNRPPYPGYWQQDVHYRIEAEIDEKKDIIHGHQWLTYWNNSPDTLYYAYFHLYQNAFQPGSYYDKLQRANGVKPVYGSYESRGLGTVIEMLQCEGQSVKQELDNTILKVWLPEPLLPGDSIAFEIRFRTYFDQGSVRRRMKLFNAYGYKHYNGVHWYPRISVYDRKFGWTTDQHLGREFYGDFGTFDVSLTFASNFIVEATGHLQNEAEVLPPDLRQKLDLSNFKDKPWGSPPSVIIPYDSTQRKTWVYHAENVHDFAFTADPIYRIDEVEWNGIRCIALVQEPHASGWLNAASFTAKVIEVFSTDIGMYAYPKIVVADARDGMEYPMITLDAGRDPGYRGLLAHEVGHNWFFGMVGNNETYRAMLDEGFTQFLTAWALEKIDGPYVVRNTPKSNYIARFRKPLPVRDYRVYYGYLADAVRGNDTPLNIHSDGFNGALRHGGGYRHVYYKTATMLYNLQYVLGDSLFLKAMQHYFNQWKFCHPYVEDFRQSIIEYTGVDLNWFFDQWIETTKNIDYQVKKVRKTGKVESGGYQYEITFKRKGRMQMPIDFTVELDYGKKLDYHIPNTWFVKQTDATVLPRWIGWDKLQPEYTARITVPAKIRNVVIDPSERLADVDMTDNRLKGNVAVNFDSKVWNFPDWRRYTLNIRPDLWFNAYDGFKPGIHMNGNYMQQKRLLHFTTWFNTRAWQGGYENIEYGDDSKKPTPLSFNFRYQTPVDRLIDDADVFIGLKWLDGLAGGVAGMQIPLTAKTSGKVYLKSMIRPRQADLNYLIHKGEWMAEKFNNSINLELTHRYRYRRGNSRLTAGLRSSALLSDFDYHYIYGESVNTTNLWRLQFRSRMYVRYGTGSRLAPESALYFSMENPEGLMENKFTRSVGFFPEQWGGFGPDVNHFHHGGGMNVRGYAGYYIVEEDDAGNTVLVYKSHSGGAINLEVDFDDIVRIKKPKWLTDYLHLDTYLFFDGGTIVYENSKGSNQFSDFRMDAGVGLALTVKKFGPLQTVDPWTVRFDMPLWLSHTPFPEGDENFRFRWLVGVNRAF